MTLKIGRFDLADIGSPERLADKIVRNLVDPQPPIDVKKIALALDVEQIEPAGDQSFEGALVTDRERSLGLILYNAYSPPQRQRFTIGHELGHFLIPTHLPTTDLGFECSDKDISGTKRGGLAKIEIEANEFSANLLLPRRTLQIEIAKVLAFDINSIEKLATKFDVSKEAMGRRCVDFLNEPTAIVFSKNRRIRYFVKSPYFPFLQIGSGDPLPPLSVSRKYDGKMGIASNFDEVSLSCWFQQVKPTHRALYEQTVLQKDGYQMTLLQLDVGSNQ